MRYESKNKIPLFITSILIIGLGVVLRLYQITENNFVYYDEGMWLNYQRAFLTLVEKNPPETLSGFFKFISIWFHNALGTGKALWAFLVGLRVLFVGVEGWYFARMISVVFGILTLGIIYIFAKRLYNSQRIALFSVLLLSVFPSHVYYSRLALQESLSTFLFLVGFYFYIFSKKFDWKVGLSSLFFSLVFFANYRMIITPAIMLFVQMVYSIGHKERIPFKKWFFHSLIFAGIVFGVGALDSGKNTQVTFGWMFHQTHLAKGHFDWINLLSYPYYIFHFETFIFGLLFFGNIYFVIKRKWREAFAFLIVVFLMGMFSLPQEKGVRYLCVVMPFMVMAVAVLLDYLLQFNKKVVRLSVLVIMFLMLGMQVYESISIVKFKTDYQSSMAFLAEKNSKVISSQAEIQKLFALKNSDVITSYPNLQYLLASYTKGYQYLILDPQAYVSYTEDGSRFSQKLKGVFSFISTQAKPLKTFAHFNPKLFDRFVLEHNENLKQSLEFLKENENNQYGMLYVYDLTPIVRSLQKHLER